MRVKNWLGEVFAISLSIGHTYPFQCKLLRIQKRITSLNLSTYDSQDILTHQPHLPTARSLDTPFHLRHPHIIFTIMF